MNLQIIHDREDNPIGIFIPIQDWKQLKKYYADLEQYETGEQTKELLITGQKETIQDKKSYSVEQIRQTHSAAYAPWTNEDEQKLKSMYFEGKSIVEIAKVLGRNRGAISSRLRKLGINIVP